MNRSKKYDYIEECLNVLATRLNSRAKNNLLNLHIHAEYFYKDLLNKLFGWKLENINMAEPNSPGIDLVDEINKIVIQVSSQATKQKINESLFRIKSIYRGYNFKFLSISKSASTLKKRQYHENDISFDPLNDIFDIDVILKVILNFDDIDSIHKIFTNEFGSISSEDFTDIRPFRKYGYVESALEVYSNSRLKYTALLAEHKELETFVELQNEGGDNIQAKVTDIHRSNDLCYLLGESGSGKTTSLWNIFKDSCGEILEGKKSKIPVVLGMRNWSIFKGFEALILEHMSHYEFCNEDFKVLLAKGEFVFLVDGINEVEVEFSKECNYELARFIVNNPGNDFVVACRSSDYSPDLIPVNKLTQRYLLANVYEISRLGREQVIEYSRNFFESSPRNAEDFLHRICVDDDDAWQASSSVVQLARIPLFLQVLLETFSKTKELPDSKARLLKALIDIILNRETEISEIHFDRIYMDRLLGSLALALENSGHSLRVPKLKIEDSILEIIPVLKSKGIANSDVDFTNTWQKITSANILRDSKDHSVEWLHQLIRDYFLGAEIAAICFTKAENPNPIAFGTRWDMANTIALDILGDTQEGIDFLWRLIDSDLESNDNFAVSAFEGQTLNLKKNLSYSIVKAVINNGDYETIELKTLVTQLPFKEVADSIDENFYNALDNSMLPRLMESIALMVMEHKSNIYAINNNYSYQNPFLSEVLLNGKRQAVKRCEEILGKYLRSSHDIASFYAAKGLWELDRTASAIRFRELSNSKSEEVRSMVRDLVDDWGIE